MSISLPKHYLDLFEPDLVSSIEQNAVRKGIPAGTALMDIGQTIKHIPIIISGAIKILQEDEEGNELLLYFIEIGDTCAMTLNCCLGNSKSEIRAIAEVDTELLLIPVRFMDVWTVQFPSWRKFIFESYNQRFSELLTAIDSLVFQNLDVRLKKYLNDLHKLHGSNELHITHQEIAYDLHTSRVVVSRLLKKMEKQGAIKLHRNSIERLTS